MPQNDVVDELMVKVGADVSSLLKDSERGILQVEKNLERLSVTSEKKVKKSFSNTFDSLAQSLTGSTGLTKRLGNTFKSVFGPTTDKFKNLTSSATGFIGTLTKIRSSTVGINSVTKALKGLGSSFGPVGAAATIAFGAVASGVGKAITAINEFWQMMSPQTLETFGIQTNVLFEQFETQFKVFLGSAEEAKNRIAEYAEFGATTPFNLPEIVEAGKLLQKFGGDALATGDSLRMVGDMASAVNRPFQEIGMWVANAYANIESGRPFGEAAQRLQELGLLSGKARNEMEQLQKSGASSEEQWTNFVTVMSIFNGMMAEQAKTMTGMRSNLEDFQEQIALVGGQPLFDTQKRGLQEYLDFLEGSKTEIKGFALSIGGIKAAFADFGQAFKMAVLENIDLEMLGSLGNKLWEIADLVTGIKLSDSLSFPETIVSWLNKVVGSVTMIADGTATERR